MKSPNAAKSRLLVNEPNAFRRPRRFRRGRFSAGGVVPVGVLALFIFCAAIVASTSSASFKAKFAGAGADRPAKAAPAPAKVTPKATRAAAAAPALAAPFQLGLEDVGSYADDCTTPKTSFAVGETACAKATNLSGLLGFERVVYWIGPDGTILQTDSVSTTSPTATRVVGARGGWKLYLSSARDGSLRKAAFFSASNAAQPAANLSVYDAIDRRISSFAAGHSITYLVVVTNNGPDAASNVVLTETPANNATFDSASSGQQSGPSFTCTRPSGTTCTLASMAAGETAEFAFVYTVNSGTAAGTEVNHSVTVASGTEELHAGDNDSTATTNITGEVTAANCALNCPDDITVVATPGQQGAFVTFSSAEGLGDCGEISSSTASGSFFPIGTTSVSVSSTEGGGACSFDVTVVTEGAPAITCPDDVTVAAAAGESEATVNPGTPSTTPASGVTVSGLRSDNQLLSAPYPVGTTLITWKATDTSNGLSSTCTQKIIVTSDACSTDTEDPTITAPADVSLETQAETTGLCGLIVPESVLGTHDVSDNCVVNVARTGVPAGNFFPIGTTTITYTATDAAGNTATDTQTVTVADKTRPVIYAPADAIYTCPSEVPAANASQAGGPLLDGTGQLVRDASGDLVPGGQPYDSCGAPTVGVTQTDNGGAGSAASPLVITRTYTATDTHGNTASASQTITVADGTAPTISAPADLLLECVADVPTASPSQATAADNCAAPAVTVSDASNGGVGTPASPLVITRTYTATDAAGNTASDSQTITVKDTTSPVLAPLSNIVVTLPGNNSATSMPVTYGPFAAADNCGGSVTVTTDIASGSQFPVGTTTVTVTATDAAGNSSSGAFTVTVLYNFTGFFSPVANPPTFNEVKAGQSVPMKFSLSGNKGPNIMVNSVSAEVACPGVPPYNEISEVYTLTAGNSGLSYDSLSDQYKYVWKTETSWANTCRQLILRLNDGTSHTANFKFK